MTEHDKKTAELAEKSMADYNKSAKYLNPLKIGTKVMIQDHQTKLWNRTGIVVTAGKHRKYWIKLPSGRCLMRNRRFLRPLMEMKDDKKCEENSPEPKSKIKEEPRRSARVRFGPDRFRYD